MSASCPASPMDSAAFATSQDRGPYEVAVPLITILCLHQASSLLIGRDMPKRDETRWFFVHGAVNALIAWLTFPCVRALVCEAGALYRVDGPLTSRQPILLALWLHIYHIVAYRMRAEDAWHHLIFVPTIGLPGYVYDWAAFGNLQLFFICGLPGSLIYAVLVCKRCGYAFASREPAVSACLNVGLRAPGVLLSNALLLHALSTTPLSPPLLAWATQVTLAPANAIYYAHQSWCRVA